MSKDKQEVTFSRFELRSKEGERLRADLRYAPTGEPKPAIVFLHGFKGFKDWGPFPTLMERFAQAGFVAVSFNFSHNGVGDDLMNFTELDRFAYNTFSRELEETQDVLRAISEVSDLSNEILIEASEIDGSRIGIIGHSRGAALTILTARWSKLVRAAVAVAPVSSFDRYSERQREKWRRDGYFETLNMRTKQVMRLNVALLDDLEKHRDRLNILAAAAHLPTLEKPLLVIAGSQDLTATPKEARAIVEAAKGDLTELEIIPQTGHTFGGQHPFAGLTPALERVMDRSVQFFRTYLVEHPIPILR